MKKALLKAGFVALVFGALGSIFGLAYANNDPNISIKTKPTRTYVDSYDACLHGHCPLFGR